MVIDEDYGVIITKEDVLTLIKSGNLYFQLPVNLHYGVHKVNTFNKLMSIAKEDNEDNFTAYFTYWDLKNDKPLFDIIVDKSLLSDEVHYYVSNHSLFGMFWLNNNTLPLGMKNVIRNLKLNVPDVNMEKYTRSNYKVAILDKDF